MKSIIRAVLSMFLTLAILTSISYPAAASSGTIWESEDNGDFSTADLTYDDYDNYGYISSSDYNGPSYGDMWKVAFSYDGYANFYLGHIPSGCNYELVVYKPFFAGILATSFNTGNKRELITVPVERGVCYYVYIFSVSGYSASNAYLFRTKLYSYSRLGKQLSGGIYNRTYYIGMGSSIYINPCLTAISDWNSFLNSSNDGSGTDFYFTRVYSSSGATFAFWGENQPDEGWVGLTRLYDSSYNLLNDLGATPNYTTKNWARADIIFNTSYAPTDNSTYMRSIANHEIGHAIGLAHVDNYFALMMQQYDVRFAYTPSYHEKKGAEVIYP